MHARRMLTSLIVLCALSAAGAFSQTSVPPAAQDSLPASVRDSDGVMSRGNDSSMDHDTESLGDIGRKFRDAKRMDVEIGPGDAKELYAELDKILSFSSKDSGFTARTAVKRQLVGEDYVEKSWAKDRNAPDEAARMARWELVLKKFGMMPRDFDLRGFLDKAHTQRNVLGYYDPRDKTIYILNWVPWSEQRPVMAHELTHALQDQNYDLQKFEFQNGRSNIARSMSVHGTGGFEREEVRRALVEGQAMIVYFDYLLEPRNLSLAKDPEIIDNLRNYIDFNLYDLPFSMQSAPRVLRETGIFPYLEGTSFVAKVLQDRGKEAAFAGIFARPPASTHEIMEPVAYLAGARPPISTIPDLQRILGSSYEPFDSGTVGELDVRIMARDFGRENDVYQVSEQWAGGAYVAVKRAGLPAAAKLTTADLGLVYVSHWKSYRAARRFAEIYKNSLQKRMVVQEESVQDNSGCLAESQCGGVLWRALLSTDEGPVTMELWEENNTLLIVQGFGESTVSQLRAAVLHPSADQDETSSGGELSMRAYDFQSFVAFQDDLQTGVMKAIENGLSVGYDLAK